MFKLAETMDDVIDLLPLFQDFHSVSGYAQEIPWDEDCVVATGMRCVDDGFILYNDHCFLAAMIYEHPFNDKVRLCGEIGFWVAPHMRSVGMGKLLLERAEKEARERGASQMCMISLDSMADVGRMYTQSGYVKRESTYMRSV